MCCILNIETSTPVCSAALSFRGDIVFNKENRDGASHAAALGIFVADAVQYARNNGYTIDAVAVSSGPGSYTGLRIGISEAKGLCYGLNIPLIAIPSLKIMTQGVIPLGIEADYYCPMIDARRMEVYAAIYNKHLQAMREINADIVDGMSYSAYLEQGKVLFFGNGAAKCKTVISSPHAIFIDDIHPLATTMVTLAEEAYNNQQFEDVAYFEPFYLKEFIATTPKNKVI